MMSWMMVLCVLVVGVKGKSELPASMPAPTQQFWTPSSRVQATVASDKSAGVATARGFFGTTAAQQSQNAVQPNNPVDLYLKHRQVGYRNTGFLTGKSAPVPPPAFNRLPAATADNNIQSYGRYGGFNLPGGGSSAPLAVPAGMHQPAFQAGQYLGQQQPGSAGQYLGQQPVPKGQYLGQQPLSKGQYLGQQPVPAGQYLGVKSPSVPQPGFLQNPRDSRIYENYKPRDPLKKTGIYIIPTPSKLYYDGVKQ